MPMTRDADLGPVIALTLGDPCGIGPELWVRILCAEAAQRREGPLFGGARLNLYGDAGVLTRAAATLGLTAEWQQAVPGLTLHEVTRLETAESTPGQPSAASGAAQVAYLEAAVAAAREGRIEALVTAPINKALCRAAGFEFPGHTEFLASRLGAPEVAMMLAGPRLRVVPATIHVPLREVPHALARTLAPAISLTLEALHGEFGIEAPRVAVAALNPHAGEAGHFGDEEVRIIGPAMARARARIGGRFSFELAGPHVPDAVYRAACAPPLGEGRYDAVVGAYHDQALIPVKLVDFDDAVNVTLGLPVPRTSPDHGVAYDVAGTGRARDGSFRAALRLARSFAGRRARAHLPPPRE